MSSCKPKSWVLKWGPMRDKNWESEKWHFKAQDWSVGRQWARPQLEPRSPCSCPSTLGIWYGELTVFLILHLVCKIIISVFLVFTVDTITDVHHSPFFGPIHPARAPPPELGLHHVVVCVQGLCVHTNMFFGYSLPVPWRPPSETCQSAPCFHASGFILFISLVCSLDSTHKWDHVVFTFLWLVYFS